MSWLFRLVKGVIIALGFILPGVSGGVLAVVLGIYERILEFLSNITKDFKENFFFFLPIGIGGILGVGLLSKPLEYLLDNYQIMVLWGFAGAIVGTIPALFKESTSQKERDSIDITWLIGTMVVGFLFLYFMEDIFGTLPSNFVGFVIAGVLCALGVLVPGLSPSNLLLILGLYTPMLTGFKDFDILGVFLPIAIGAFITFILFSKLMNQLIKTKHSRVFHFILGIVLASTVLIVIPPVASYQNVTVLEIVISAVLFVGGCALGLWMSKLEEKYK